MQAVQMLVRELHKFAFVLDATALTQACGPGLAVVFEQNDERLRLRQRRDFAVNASRCRAVPLYNCFQHPHRTRVTARRVCYQIIDPIAVDHDVMQRLPLLCHAASFPNMSCSGSQCTSTSALVMTMKAVQPGNQKLANALGGT